MVTARSTKVVAAEFQGRVDRIHIYAGQRVRAGDPIAKLDDTELRAQIESTRAQELAARADAGAAGAQAYAATLAYRRDARLGRKGYVARSAVDNSRAQSQALGAQTAASASRADGLRAERVRLEGLAAKAELAAPIDGVVMMVKVKEGEVAQRGTPVARVFDPRDLVVKFAVPREHRHRVTLGHRVELRLEGVKRPLWATILRIADEEPPITFSVVEADIDDSKLAPDEVRVTAQGRVRFVETVARAPHGGKR